MEREILCLDLTKLKGFSYKLILFGIKKSLIDIKYVISGSLRNLEEPTFILIYLNFNKDRKKIDFIDNSICASENLPPDLYGVCLKYKSDKIVWFDARTETDNFLNRIKWFLKLPKNEIPF